MDAAAPLREAGKEHQKAVPEHGRHYSQDQRRGVSGKSYVFGRCTSGNTEASRTGEWEKSKRAALTPNLLVIAGTASSFAVELTPGVCPHPLHWRHSFAVQSESYDPSCRSCITPSPRSYLRRLWGCCHKPSHPTAGRSGHPDVGGLFLRKTSPPVSWRTPGLIFPASRAHRNLSDRGLTASSARTNRGSSNAKIAVPTVSYARAESCFRC